MTGAPIKAGCISRPGRGKISRRITGNFKFSERKRGTSAACYAPFRGSQPTSRHLRGPPFYRIFPLCQTLIESLTLTQHEDRSLLDIYIYMLLHFKIYTYTTNISHDVNRCATESLKFLVSRFPNRANNHFQFSNEIDNPLH